MSNNIAAVKRRKRFRSRGIIASFTTAVAALSSPVAQASPAGPSGPTQASYLQPASGGCSGPCPPGYISTLTGGGVGDHVAATSAPISGADGLAVGPDGSIFVADAGHNLIRKISSGDISTVAGNGFNGFQGDGSNWLGGMELSDPQAVAVDGQGDVFIADTGNNRIRELSASGVLTTVVGGGAQNAVPGLAATSISLAYPGGVTVDQQGDLFVADTGNNQILEVSAGNVSTVLTGTAINSTSAASPTSLALDASGDLFSLWQTGDGQALVESSGGTATVVAGGCSTSGGSAGCTSPSVTISGPTPALGTPLYIDATTVTPAGHILLASNNQLLSLDVQSEILSPVTQAQLPRSVGGLVGDSAGTVYWGSALAVSTINANGSIGSFAGDNSPGFYGNGVSYATAGYDDPHGVAVDAADDVYIADTGDNQVREISAATGQITTIAGTGGPGYSGDGGPATSAQLDGPRSVAVDSQGDVYIADTINGAVREVTPNGIISTLAGGPTNALGVTLQDPYSVAVDGGGNVYIADPGTDKVVEVSSGQSLTLMADQSAVGLRSVGAVAVDQHGNILVGQTETGAFADTLSSEVAKINPVSGNLTVIASLPGSVTGLAADPDGELFAAVGTMDTVVDAKRQTAGQPSVTRNGPTANVACADCGIVSESIIGIDPASSAERRVAGTGQYGYSGDGSWGFEASLNLPSALAIDPTGSLLIADSGNNVIRYVQGPIPYPAAGQPQTQSVLVDPRSGVHPGQHIGPKDPSAAGNCGCGAGGSAAVTTGEPVNVGTGAMIESAIDLTVAGAGLPLEFSRSYDSSLAQDQEATGTAPSPLGYGWSYNLGMTLTVNPTTGEATVDQETGSEIGFDPYSANTSPAWCTATTNFCSNDPQILATLSHNADGTWTMTRQVSGQTTFTFSTSGTLTNESDTQGNTLTASPGTPGSGACPTSATTCTVWTSSASGRTLTLAFDSSGRLTQAADGAGNAATYCYFGQGCATGQAGSSQDLASATIPGGLTTSYGYDPTNTNPHLVNDLVAETYPDGGTLTNVYDSSGRVVSQVAPGDTMTLAYAGDNNSYTGGTTTVSTYPDGTSSTVPAQVVQYQYSSGVLIAETTGYGTPQAATTFYDHDPVSLGDTTVQDGDGHATSSTITGYTGSPLQVGDVTSSTDAAGNTTQYAYNSFNQAWCEVEPAETLAGVTCPPSPPASPPAPGASDPWAGATISFYNAADQLTATTDALGRTTVYTYTSSGSGVPAGLEYCTVDPVDYAANLACPAYGAAHVKGTTTETFDAAGEVLTSTGPDGDTTSYKYTDPSHPGRPTVTVDPDGQTTTVVYDTAGEVTSSTVSFGSYRAVTENAYNSAGQLYCSVAPQQAAKGITCPASPPAASSPPAGVTSNFYNPDGQLVQETGPTGATTVYAYDAAGEKYCTVDPQEYAAGVTCPATPPTSPPAAGSSDPYLGATIDTYNTSGQLVQQTGPTGGVTLSSYDGAENLTSQTVESGSSGAPNVTTSYTYDPDNRQVSATVNQGGSTASTTEQAYDPDGNVYCQVSAKAVASGAFQCPAWQASWIDGPPAVGSLYATGSPAAAQAEAVTTSFYDADGERVQSSNPDQATTVAEYDADGRAVCAETAADLTAYLSSHSGAGWPYACPTTPPTTPPAAGSNPGYETTVYDPAGRTLSSSDAAGDTTSYSYDPDGQTLTTKDPDGQTSTSCYYWQTSSCASGAPAGGGAATSLYTSATPPVQGVTSGIATTYTYLPGGARASVKTAAGTATYTYDPAGNPLTVTYSGPGAGYQTSANTTYTYTAGLLSTVADGTGTTTYGYDQAGEVTSISLAAKAGSGLSSGTTSYNYYPGGQVASITYPHAPAGAASAAVNEAYNPNGQLSSVTDWYGNTTNFGYDPDGNTTTTAYPNNTTVTNTYDLGDAPTVITAQTGTPGNLGVTLASMAWTLNSAEQPTAETDSGALTGGDSYSYAPADRLGTTKQAPATTATTEAYNPDGDPTGLPNGNTQTFNSADQDTANLTPPRVPTIYGYNPTGDRTTTVTSTGTTTATYNQNDQLAAVAQASADSYEATVKADNPTDWWRLDDPAGTATAADSSSNNHPATLANSPTQGQPGALTGDPSSSTSFNGTNQYCQAANSAAPDFTGTSPFSLEVWIKPTTGTGDTSYRRILSKEHDSPTKSGWILDIYQGTIRFERWNANTSSIVASPTSAPISTSKWTLVDATYDGTTMRLYLNGVQVASTTSSLAIPALPSTTPVLLGGLADGSDYAGGLQDAAVYTAALTPARVAAHYSAGTTTASSTPTTYLYTSQGILTGRTVGTTTATLTWDDAAVPNLLSDGTTDYLYGPAGPIEQASTAADSVYYYLTDRQRSTRALISAPGTIASTYTYNAYGTLTATTGTAATSLLFDGQYQDPTTGLYYLRARWYDPVTGQFTTVDPEVSDTDQPYAYAAGNPLVFGDPTGARPQTVEGSGPCTPDNGPSSDAAPQPAGSPGASPGASPSESVTQSNSPAGGYPIPCGKSWSPPYWESTALEAVFTNFCEDAVPFYSGGKYGKSSAATPGIANKVEFIFTLQPYLAATAGPDGVAESGVRYQYNGGRFNQNSPHVESAYYGFHGILNKIPYRPDGSTITGTDDFSWASPSGSLWNVYLQFHIVVETSPNVLQP
jgi:RHS repeat-associated protein